ncbi:MAG TPA: carboxypeptidase regulatory-like domain-containing protein [Bryobacteraceae bacterium]|nr:carboxypeptidase regulatory-like domain-containing protein [Bryobacteraceae bacterium]
MILRSVIAFSLAACFAASAANVSGTVTLLDSRDPAVRGRKDFSGVVVWLEPVSGSASVRPSPRAQIIQKNKRFTPHILAIAAGTTVDFPNFDPIFHNAFSNFEGKVFDVGLYAPGASRAVRFDRPGIVRVFCNIHPHMSAIIAVVNTPHFATSQTDGRYQIANVPAGEYRLQVMHERATQETLDRLARRVVITDGAFTISPIEISESGYLPVPHKNKYGKPYPPNADDGPYPGAKK